MAKRKRLSPANPEMFGAAPETKSALARAPIADVAADAAQSAALSDVVQELQAARVSGRMVLSLPVAEIVLDHIVRDRVVVQEDDMAALRQSIAERGQQTPIEVLKTDTGGYGLISGWRRCTAIAQLAEAGQHSGQVLALLRAPVEASETYLAMVEENEIRVGLSYYERARIAAEAVRQGVFESEKAALLTLFRSASRAKRSKIRSFLPVVNGLDGALRFPHMIGERLGLRLSAALEADPELFWRASAALLGAKPQSAEAEAALLTKMMAESAARIAPPEAKAPAKPDAVSRRPVAKDLEAEWDASGTWLRLSGKQMSYELRMDLLNYLRRSLPK